MSTQSAKGPHPITLRFKLLAEQLGAELTSSPNAGKGWKAIVADQLGVSPSFLSKVLGGHREVSVDAAKAAAERVKISFRWFQSTTDEHYSRYRKPTVDWFAADESAAKFIGWVGGSKKNVAAQMTGGTIDLDWMDKLVDEFCGWNAVRLAQEAQALQGPARRAVAFRLMKELANLPPMEMSLGAMLAAGLHDAAAAGPTDEAEETP